MKHYKPLKIILASSSPYRLAQLQQHGFSVESFTPDVDESEQTGEKPTVRANRLAKEKAASVSKRVKHTGKTLIVASDQVCHCNGDIYHKPGSMDLAAKHLARFSGQWVTFSTALSVIKRNKPSHRNTPKGTREPLFPVCCPQGFFSDIDYVSLEEHQQLKKYTRSLVGHRLS